MLFSHGGIFHLVGFFKRKYLVDRFVKNGRHLQCQNRRVGLQSYESFSHLNIFSARKTCLMCGMS